MNDWIDWAGGDCPVAPGTNVEIRIRGIDGAQTQPAMPAEELSWAHCDAFSDIVAYRTADQEVAHEDAQ